MTAGHMHLILNHFPIVGLIVGLGVLAYGMFSKSLDIKKVGLGVIVVMALIAIPAYLTGEEAEELVEHLPGISDHDIHEHEELAEKAVIMMAILGSMALFALYAFWKKMKVAKTMTMITLVFGLITFGVFAKVGNLGGKIRHTELSDEKTPTTQGVLRQDDDDDDD